MKLIFIPTGSWWLSLMALGILLLLVVLLYPPRVRHLPGFTQRLLIGLRLLAAVLLGWALFRPAIQYSESDTKSAVMLVLADQSRSMSTNDAPGRISRRAELVKLVNDNADHFDTLTDQVEILQYDFSNELIPTDQFLEAAEGEQSAIGSVLESVLRETQRQRVVGVILMSDGAQRSQVPYDADPRQQARRFGELQIPIYPVAFGGSGLADTVTDLAVEEMLVDPLVFQKKTVSVKANIRAYGAAGKKLTIRLLVENRQGVKLGEAGVMEVPPASLYAKPVTQIETDKNADVIPVELSFIPSLPGEYKIALEVVPVSGELKSTNNIQETIITVQKGGIKIAYFDKLLRPEQKFIRLTNSSEKIQIDYQLIRSGRLGKKEQIDQQFFEQGAYDAYIIGDVPASIFTDQQLRNLATHVDEGAGLLMLGGYQSFGPGGYANTPLADLLPVIMRATEVQVGNEIARDLHYLDQLKMLPTQRGIDHYIMRLDSPSQNRERWLSLAPMQGANKLRKKNDLVEVLAQTEAGLPLLFVHEVGQARVAALAADTTYQWVLAGQADDHQRFWRQMILWLSRKELDKDQSVWVTLNPRNYDTRQKVTPTLGARDEKGQPLKNVKFDVSVLGPENQQFNLAATKQGQNYSALFQNTDLPGDYWVKVAAKQDDQIIGFDAWTRFIVDSRDLEMDNPAADLALLEDIAAQSGGTVLTPEQLSGFLQRITTEGWSNPEYVKITRIPLWDNWTFLFLFVGCMTLEWYIRKKRGLV